MSEKRVSVTVRHNDGSANDLDGLKCAVIMGKASDRVPLIFTGISSDKDLAMMFISLFGNTEIGERMRRAASMAMEYLICDGGVGFQQITVRNDKKIIHADDDTMQ